MHHVLIQARHHDGDEGSAEQLLPEVLRRHPVVPHEHAAVLVGSYRLHGFAHAHAQLLRHIIYNKEQRGEHAGGLECVGPHQRLDAAAARVEPDEQRHAHDGYGERHAHGVEHEALQNDADDVEAHGGARHLRREEEPCAGLVRPLAEPLLQIRVDGR